MNEFVLLLVIAATIYLWVEIRAVKRDMRQAEEERRLHQARRDHPSTGRWI